MVYLLRKSESIVLTRTSVGHVPSLGFHLIQRDHAEMAALMSDLFPLTNDQWQEWYSAELFSLISS